MDEVKEVREQQSGNTRAVRKEMRKEKKKEKTNNDIPPRHAHPPSLSLSRNKIPCSPDRTPYSIDKIRD